MKKIHVKRRTADHDTRRIMIGIALVLLGVLTVLNLLILSNPFKAVPAQGAGMYQTK
jgi:hypothetical protein